VNKKRSSIDRKAREQLLARVVAMQEKGRPLRTDRTSSSSFTDFASLPGYEELRVHQVMGEKFGLENPYFRMHDGLAGAHTSIGGRRYLNFACYDYLGLNGEKVIQDAAKAAIDRYGISASGSRHVSGERPAHRSLERALADHYGVDDCVVFVSGYATNLGVIGQILTPRDLMIHDAQIHNSAIMGGVLSGATRQSFLHNDLDNLEAILKATRAKVERVLIVVEGLYSMDGDFPDLPRLIEIKKRYNAWLMVDEAHALGVMGTRGFGIAEHFGVDGREVDIWMGTLSKTLVGCGGYIAGPKDLVQYLKSMVGTFTYSVGMPPVIAVTAEKALDILHKEPARVAKLKDNSVYFAQEARRAGLDTGTSAATAVCPIMVGDSIRAVALTQRLFERGVNVLPVLYPAVPANSARLRFFLTAMHSHDDIQQAISVTAEELGGLGDTMRKLGVPGY
jgi:8-amino-7-oxononanoate synthase